MKKIIFVMLLIFSVFSVIFVLPSCSDSEKDGQKAEYVPDLPAVDMKGKAFRIFTTGWWNYEPLAISDIVKEEIVGEHMNDAVFNRQKFVEDKYNIKLEQINVDTSEDATGKIIASVQANDGAYDVCLVRNMYFNTLITNRCAADLETIPNINIDQPWWDSNSYDSFSLLGKHYGICSDITMNDDTAVWNVSFNKNILQELGLESPYNLVKEGKWTYDKVFEMSRAAVKDLNGDGVINSSDRYGMVHLDDSIVGMVNGIGINIGEVDKEGKLVFTFEKGDNLSKLINIFTSLYDKNYICNVHAMEGVDFAQGRALFAFFGIYLSIDFRNMDDDFGILPYPKYDEKQTEYKSSVSPLFTTLAIVPTTNLNLNDTGIILEEMAYQGYKNIRPAFYDKLLQGKTARDEESSEMLEYLFDNVVYDVGAIWNIAGFSTEIGSILAHNYDLNIASFIEARKGLIENNIAEIMEAMQ